MSDRPRLRVLVVDDEPLGRERVIGLLEGEEDIDVVGTAEDGDEAIQAIRSLVPDLVFLDIQMPNRSGLDVLRDLGPASMPATVLTTAHDEYAVDAYRFEPVDYLLKPFSDERFDEALTRARNRLKLEGIANLRERLLSLLDDEERTAPRREAVEYLERIAVQMRGRMRVIPVDEIDYISASGVYAKLHAGEAQYLVRTSLQTLEEQLDPREFCRIHRSEIVRLDRIEILYRGRGGEYSVKLRDDTILRVSRTRREHLEQRLGRL